MSASEITCDDVGTLITACRSKSRCISFSQQSLLRSVCMVMVVVMNIYAIGKEVVQISQQVQ